MQLMKYKPTIFRRFFYNSLNEMGRQVCLILFIYFFVFYLFNLKHFGGGV